MNIRPFLIFFSIALLFAPNIIGQTINDDNRDNIWLFGYDSFTQPGFGGFVLDFNSNIPEVYYEPKEMEFNQTSATICDTDGNLLFYTNGIYIANAAHQMMVNGDSLSPGPGTFSYPSGLPISQGLIILPIPENEKKYILIHGLLDIPPGLGPIYSHLYYSIIDMELDNGLGAVTEKNVEIMEGQLHRGKITATRHGNGRDWWVVIPEHDTNRYFRMLLTPDGLEGPYLQTIGSPNMSGIGQSIFTPNGYKYIRYENANINEGTYLNFYDFDRCTGLLSNQLQLNQIDTSWGNGLAVSPNSRYAYFSAFRYVYQFDLWADDIIASKDTIAVYDGFVSPWPFSSTFYLAQLGPDGKIYINTRDATTVMHVIHDPDKKGEACNLEQHGIQFPAYNSFTIPNSPNFRLGPLDGSPCDTLGLDNIPIAKYRYEQPDSNDYLKVAFRNLSYYEPATWHWDFGDNTTSQDTSPVHVFMQDGTYEVCLTVSNANGENTFCRTLFLGTVGTGEAMPTVEVSIFPNPCREGVNVIIGDYLPRDAKVVIYDAVGQQHKVQAVQTGWNTVRLDGLQTGIYFYEIWENSTLLKSGKLVKME